MELYLDNKRIFGVSHSLAYSEIASLLPFRGDFYLLHEGKRVCEDATELVGRLDVVCRLVGGKGGFGSMLRAIGAQIEKTTNREACRDLSGRRLRDINEEQRLKNWIAAQAEREKEAAEKKQKKLERLMEKPKHEFKDEEYDKIRSALPEKVEDAVTQGLQASCSGKRKPAEKKEVPRKRPKLWIDEELSASDEESGDDAPANAGPVAKVQ
ncbi:splicing regulator SDE2-like [Tenebrio molitor]|jgi:ribosomal protein L12E/L44/L45/RPP1/RPP2|uniref:splicing regulator SDE2-like n=1 Tax=Tenebrio molitor TaxID=7067 RepID=UPI003624AC13